ncbi:MAG: ModE family transcriptional regulator [Novosphingobium sp.]
MTNHRLQIRVRIYCGDEIAMGPGKADLLDAIASHGSISGAARVLDLSYRRAWLLVDAMNRCWKEPLVATAPGGGAWVSEFGAAILAGYRAIQLAAECVEGSSDWARMQAGLLAVPRVHQGDD